jgi:hypothetical protein
MQLVRRAGGCGGVGGARRSAHSAADLVPELQQQDDEAAEARYAIQHFGGHLRGHHLWSRLDRL